ncbi:uncharacterized protein LOC143202138 [Rhynchophorus ferrugineus]|uniref:Uncharacterized protein n=1 Tax=Rhynchophorus ferrugineus TaxID=354439 RepID=A0A834ING2_RHYFE|nr:hypothetical protein GWI33_022428 [Rhynchophorus ferrugineus]
MMSNTIELPFFPQYEIDRIFDDNITVMWFEPKFSQSHYNVHNKTNGSNACTLIVVLIAAHLDKKKLLIYESEYSTNKDLIQFLAISMLQGNKIHEELKMRRLLKHLNLNVPEALKYTENQTFNLVEWKSSIFMERLSKSLFENIKNTYMEWMKLKNKPSNDLYVILIADSRTVLFLFQDKPQTVTLFDSHQHTAEKGAFIAICHRSKLGYLCHWFRDVIRACYNSDPKLYELSFLYFKHKA